MAALILDGRALAQELRAQLHARCDALRERGIAPRLVVAIAGDDAASVAYANALAAAGGKLGVDVEVDALPHDVTAGALRARLEALGADSTVHGVILQQPLPSHLAAGAVTDAIPLAKDVDAANPATQGRLLAAQSARFVPATAAAILMLIERSPHAHLAGVRACVVGRSRVVGLPVALLIVARSATVTVAHSKTADLGRHTRDAELLVVAAGSAGLIRADMVAPGATVIDAGTSFVDGRMTGDVRYDDVAAVAGALTPVPGGVGPVTNAALLRNVVAAAESLAEDASPAGAANRPSR